MSPRRSPMVGRGVPAEPTPDSRLQPAARLASTPHQQGRELRDGSRVRPTNSDLSPGTAREYARPTNSDLSPGTAREYARIAFPVLFTGGKRAFQTAR
jgi:hypothetical protein